MAIYFQAICAGIICWQCLAMGLLGAWPSNTIEIFRSNETTLNRPMTLTEVSLFGSVGAIGALISTPLTGYLLDKVGRKYCAIISGCMQIICWAIVTLFSNVESVLFAVTIAGLGATGFLVVPVYISEICENSVRGALTSGANIFYGVGVLMSYVLGGFVSYYTLVYINLALSTFGLLGMIAMKESPLLLMKKGLEEEAAKSIAFFRRAKVDSKVVMEEMDLLRKAFSVEMDEKVTCPEEEKLNQMTEPAVKEKLSMWQFIKKSRSTQLASLVTFVLAIASIFQGLIAVQVYAKPLFADAIPNMSSTLCCIILAIVNVISGTTAAFLTDRAGRRPLMIYSSTFTGLCCVLLGTQLQYHWAPHWMTAVFIYFYTAGFTCGAGTVIYVLTAEAFLPEVKSLMSMIVYELAWTSCFVILFIFNPLVEAWGLGAVFHIFAVICFATAIFAHFLMPETKGMPIHVIQEMFLNMRAKKNVVK